MFDKSDGLERWFSGEPLALCFSSLVTSVLSFRPLLYLDFCSLNGIVVFSTDSSKQRNNRQQSQGDKATNRVHKRTVTRIRGEQSISEASFSSAVHMFAVFCPFTGLYGKLDKRLLRLAAQVQFTFLAGEGTKIVIAANGERTA